MANKIRYSVGGTKATVGKNAGKVLYRPILQLGGIIDLADLAKHMSDHDSKFNEGDVYAVLIETVKCIKEFAAQGIKVRLSDLGAFAPAIKTRSDLSAEDVTAQNISSVTLRWQTGARFKNFKSECEFENVPKRKNVALLNQAEKSGQTTMTLAEKASQGSGSGGSGGGNGAGGE